MAEGALEAKFGRARISLRDSSEGRAIDAAMSPGSTFGDADDSWLISRYKRPCDYAHSRAGHDNGGFWESNGPLFVPRALATVDSLTGELVMELLVGVAREEGTTVILVTHEPRVAAYAARAVMVRDGRLTLPVDAAVGR